MSKDGSFKVYVKSKKSEDEYCVLINEIPDSGYSFNFLDFEPLDIENYRPIWVSFRDSQEIITEKDKKIKKLEEENKNLVKDLKTVARININNEHIGVLEINKQLKEANDYLDTIKQATKAFLDENDDCRFIHAMVLEYQAKYKEDN